jgi:hypothetical protein
MQWISVKDKLPPVGEFKDKSINVLISDGVNIGFGTFKFNDTEYSKAHWTYHIPEHYERDDNNVTHWAYFPELPNVLINSDRDILIKYTDYLISEGEIDNSMNKPSGVRVDEYIEDIQNEINDLLCPFYDKCTNKRKGEHCNSELPHELYCFNK